MRGRSESTEQNLQRQHIQKLIMMATVATTVCGGLSHAETVAKKPNIITVFIDDLGWGDFSCFGNEHAETPAIDRLAAEGIRFTQFYVNSPICSPSRVALTTGHYPQRWKIGSYLAHRNENEKRGIAQWLDPAAPTLARFLKQAATAPVTLASGIWAGSGMSMMLRRSQTMVLMHP